jgi:hypothetical protein
MGYMRQHVVLLGALVGALTIALAIGAAEGGAADPACAGKPLCVTITATPNPASRSPAGIDTSTDHYVSYSVTVANGGTTSNLVNLTVTAVWADVGAATTSDYRSAFSDSRCSVTGTRTLTCTVPKSLGPGAFETYLLVFRTATELGEPPLSATDTTLTVTARAKEGKPKGSGNTAVVIVPNTTSYEPQPELDVSTAGGGLTTTLATAAEFGGQSSKLRVPGDDAPRGIFRLEETDDYTCPVGLDCFGQQVQTTAPGLSPVNVQITFIGQLPSGKNEGNITIFHDRDAAPDVTFSATCSGLFGSEPPTLEMPCRRVEIKDHLPNGIEVVEIDIWDTINGRFNGG